MPKPKKKVWSGKTGSDKDLSASESNNTKAGSSTSTGTSDDLTQSSQTSGDHKGSSDKSANQSKSGRNPKADKVAKTSKTPASQKSKAKSSVNGGHSAKPSSPKRAKSGKKGNSPAPSSGKGAQHPTSNGADEVATGSVSGTNSYSSLGMKKFSGSIQITDTPPMGELKGNVIHDSRNYVTGHIIDNNLSTDSFSRNFDRSEGLLNSVTVAKKMQVKLKRYPQGLLTNALPRPVDMALDIMYNFDFTLRDEVYDAPKPSTINHVNELNLSRSLHFERDSRNSMVIKKGSTDGSFENGSQNFSLISYRREGSSARFQEVDTFVTVTDDNVNARANLRRRVHSTVGQGALNPVQYKKYHHGVNFNTHKNITEFELDTDTVDMYNQFLLLFKALRTARLEELPKNKTETTRLQYIRPWMMTYDFISTVIKPMIEYATFLYIVIDAIDSCLSSQPVIAEKLGLVDSIFRYFTNLPNKARQTIGESIAYLKQVFDKIPVDSKVVEAWNTHKEMTLGTGGHLEDGDNPLVIPYFRLFWKDMEQKVQVVTANDNPSVYFSIDIPTGSWLNDLLDDIQGEFLLFQAEDKSSYVFTDHDDKKFETEATARNGNHAYVTVSAARFTPFMADFIAAVTRHRSTIITKLVTRFRDLHSWFNMLETFDIFQGTDFKKMSPNFPTFMKVTPKQPGGPNGTIPRLYATTRFTYDRTVDSPIRVGVNDNIEHLAHANHHFVYDAADDKYSVDMMIRALVVDRDLGKDDLVSVIISSSMFLPYTTIRHEHILPNTTPPAVAHLVDYGLGGMTIHENAVICEYTNIKRQSYAMSVNRTRGVTFVGGTTMNPNVEFYYLSNNPNAFFGRMRYNAIRSYWKSLGVGKPKHRIIAPNGPHNSTRAVMNTPTPIQRYFVEPSVFDYVPRWVYRPFQTVTTALTMDTEASVDMGQFVLEGEKLHGK